MLESEPACPFCGGVPGRKRTGASWVRGTTRAAIFFFGASVAAACGSDGSRGEMVAPPYGAPPPPPPPLEPDERLEDPPDENIQPMYGAPPPPPPDEEVPPGESDVESPGIGAADQAPGASPMPTSPNWIGEPE